jgi:hypothetical protein
LSSSSLTLKINSLNCNRQFAARRDTEDSYTINPALVEGLATELNNNNIHTGTILIQANFIDMDPSYTFNYNDATGVKLPGRYDILLIADQIDSRGGTIDLSGFNSSSSPPKPPKAQSGEEGSRGWHGHTGGPGGNGGIGMNIKVFCVQITNIEILSNGGNGANGGDGGDGGNGGDWLPADGVMHAGSGGDGGNGGDGGVGGNRGSIEVILCSTSPSFVVTDHLHSNGGNGGSGGHGGFPGSAGSGQPPVQPGGRPGRPGRIGDSGTGSIPKVEIVDFDELWRRVAIEKQCEQPG